MSNTRKKGFYNRLKKKSALLIIDFACQVTFQNLNCHEKTPGQVNLYRRDIADFSVSSITSVGRKSAGTRTGPRTYFFLSGSSKSPKRAPMA